MQKMVKIILLPGILSPVPGGFLIALSHAMGSPHGLDEGNDAKNGKDHSFTGHLVSALGLCFCSSYHNPHIMLQYVVVAEKLAYVYQVSSRRNLHAAAALPA